jgi:hypothetical protein
MNSDLMFTADGIEPLSQAGKDYVRALFAKAYLEAWDNGLHMEFDSRDTLERVTDNVPEPWSPVQIPTNAPGYQDDYYDYDPEARPEDDMDYIDTDQTEGE